MERLRLQLVNGHRHSAQVEQSQASGRTLQVITLAFALILQAILASAQAGDATTTKRQPENASAPITGAMVPPTGYIIGAEDVLRIVFWREKDISTDITVRPDSKITLPLINDLETAGLTPDELRDRVNKIASQYIEDPNATIIVRKINSRKVFITGQVGKPSVYELDGPTNVLQLIAMASGMAEYANAENISIMQTENGRATALRFNYKDMAQRKNLEQNIVLKPDNTIVVP